MCTNGTVDVVTLTLAHSVAGHDDYYATGRSDCPGIEGSPFWTATSDPLS